MASICPLLMTTLYVTPSFQSLSALAPSDSDLGWTPDRSNVGCACLLRVAVDSTASVAQLLAILSLPADGGNGSTLIANTGT